MSTAPALAFSHVGLFVRDEAAMADFYERVLGFTVTDRGQLGAARLAFFSRDPHEHHQIVMVSGRAETLPFNVINQISFRVAGLAELRAAHDRVAAERVADLVAVTHGNAWSIYFLDPDGNRLEIFADTPWYVRQPLREPIDFALTDDVIFQRTEALCRALPDFKPVATWQAEMAGRMRAAAEA